MQDERKFTLKQRRTADLGYHSSAALLGSKMITANKGGGQVQSSLALKGMDFGLKCVTAISVIQNKVWQMELFLSKASSV